MCPGLPSNILKASQIILSYCFAIKTFKMYRMELTGVGGGLLGVFSLSIPPGYLFRYFYIV